MRLVDAQGRPLVVEAHQAADLVEAGLATDGRPVRLGRLDALRLWLAGLELPVRSRPQAPPRRIRGVAYELLIIDDPPKRPRP